MNSKFVRPGLMILLAFSLIACGAIPVPELIGLISEPTNTPVPPSTTPTPLPTATQTPLPTNTPTATPNAKATQIAIEKVTQVIRSAEIRAELAKLGLPNQGSLAWVSDEAETLSVADYNSWAYDFIADSEGYANFILKTDITWASKSGLAGCGVVFRAASMYLDRASHYELLMMRLAGAPAWAIMYYENGKFENNLFGRLQYNKVIDVKPDSTNTYYLVVNGDKMTLYANGKRLGAALSNKLSKGYLAWYVSQESGESSCTFNNAWLWELP